MEIFKLFGTILVDSSKAEQSISKADDKAKGLMSSFGGVVSGIGNGILKVGELAAKGLAVGATAFAGLSAKALQLGGDLEQNMGGAEAVFKDFADTVKNKGETAFKDMGLSMSDFLATSNKMGALFQGAGFGIEESAKLSTEAMQRAADVASIMGIDTSAAMDAVAGAAKGNFTMMDNLGVAMNDTAIAAYAMEKGINKSTKEMSQQEKIGLAMEMFLDKTAYAAGNYAKENETLAGALSTTKAALTNFLSGAGDVDSFVDSFSGLADVVSDKLEELLPRLTTGLTDIGQQLIPKIPPLIQKLLPAIITGAAALMDGLVAVLPGLTQAVSDVIPMIIDAILSMLPLLIDVGMQILVQLAMSIGQSLPVLIPAVVEAVVAIAQAFIDNFPLVIDAFLQLISGLVEGLFSAFDSWNVKSNETASSVIDTLKNIWNTFKDVLSSIIDIIKSFVDIGKALWETFGDIILDRAKHIWDAIKIVIDQALDVIKTVFSVFVNIFKGNWEGAWNDIVSYFERTWERIKDFLANALDMLVNGLIMVAVRLFAAAQETFDNIHKAFTEIWDKIKAWFEEAKEDPVKAILSIATSLFNAGKDIFSSLWDGLKSVWTGITDWVSGCIDWIKDKVAFWKSESDKVNNRDSSSGGYDYDDYDGSHATGLPYVPYDNYIAQLHEGERVLTRQEATQYNKGQTGNNVTVSKLADTIIVREEADIDKIAIALDKKIKKETRL